MAPKRSLDSKPLDEEEMLMCAAALLELSASFLNNKQRKIVAPVKGNPRKGPEVTGREVARKPEKQTGKNTKVEWELGLPTLSPVDSLRNKSKVGNFLEACSLCKKKLHDKDVFMYG
ncbi:hypothetical protein L6164_025704 [Bauhinia variegata]|uniref:Uncharacterized protein n=1 Tax=Bauhinia variegata TaxID=167791 RepID=A0ACB9M1M2_BAUVA|nr:hypothetical protein L6164_025704 [Bauhinia variegata]